MDGLWDLLKLRGPWGTFKEGGSAERERTREEGSNRRRGRKYEGVELKNEGEEGG